MIVYLGEEGVFEGEELRSTLYDKHRIFAKQLGFSRPSRTGSNKQLYLVDKFSLAYVYQNNILPIKRVDQEALQKVVVSDEYNVYCKLRPHYYLLNGSKFGGLFLAYKQNPSNSHAEAIVFTKGGVVYASRLAEAAKKKCLYVDSASLQMIQIMRILE